MTEIYQYLRRGVDLTNETADLGVVFADWPKDRSVILHVCTPHPEVAQFIENWLEEFAKNNLQAGAAAERSFSLYLSTREPRYTLVLESGIAVAATADVYVSETLFWDLAARTRSLYTAYILGGEIVVRSSQSMDLRDLAHMDKILEVIHDALARKGISLVSLAEKGA